MDQLIKQKIETILSNKLDDTTVSCEEKLALVVVYYEAEKLRFNEKIDLISKSGNEDRESIVSSATLEHQINALQSEILFLNEKNECQQLMFSDTLIYIAQLKEEIESLKTQLS